MDLDNDGKLDVLSGCYDCYLDFVPDGEPGRMAGLFHVLRGKGKHKFTTPEVVNGSDGKPLIAGSPYKPFDEEAAEDQFDEDGVMVMPGQDNFLTRPTAVDLNGDGHLDLVVGNSVGTFFMVKGLGKGKFEAASTQINGGGKPLSVDGASDPCMVDWDDDGDLDIVSGSGVGGVFLARNVGDKSQYKFEPFEELVAAPEFNFGEKVFGASHIKGPVRSTRVCVEDVDGDGLLDLVVGDTFRVLYVENGLEEGEARKKMAKLEKEMEKQMLEIGPRQEKIFLEIDRLAASNDKDAEEKSEKLFVELEKLEKKLAPIHEKLDAIVREELSGSVWVFHQIKKNAPAAKDQEVTGK